MNRLAATTLALCLAAAPLAAQSQFRGDLDGSQENPPVVTSAGGWSTFILNANNTITYDVRTYGLTANAAHIHLGAVGVNGGVLFTLAGGPTSWSGTTAVLTAGQVTSLQTAGMYVNVHTNANPGGEIRGQILARPLNFAATLQGSQEVPPVVTAAGGTGTAVVNSNNTITYNVTTSGPTGNAAHIHTGNPGVAGGVLFTLSGGPTSWSGTTAAMTPAQFTTLQAGGMYFNVHTNANPGGEIRGQIFPLGVSFGQPCPWSGGTATMTQTGATMENELITLTIAGGVPNGPGRIQASFTPRATVQNGCPYFLMTPLVRDVAITLTGSGGRSVVTRLPNVASDLNVFVQFVGMEGAVVYSTTGLALTIQQL